MRLGLGLCVLAALVGSAEARSAPPRAALVVVAPPGPTPEQLEAARARLSARFVLEDRAELRRMLEGFAAAPTAEARVRDALERARRRMRQLDLAGVGVALDEAAAAASALPPTPEARALLAQLFLRRASTALAAHDQRAAARAVGLALGAAPELSLDPAEASPPMVQLVDGERARRARAKRVEIALRADGAPTQVSIAGATRGATPLRLDDVPRGPVVVWWTREGHAPKVTWGEAEEGASFSAQLVPLDAVAVTAPLVEALRRADARTRADAVRALAASLGADVVALVGADPQAPTAIIEIERAVSTPGAGSDRSLSLSSGTPAPARRPWYRKGWVWGVVAGSAIAVGGAVALGVVFGRSGTPTTPPAGSTELTCCR